MSEVARLPEAWQAAHAANMDTPTTFESFFEGESERLLRALCVITGSRAEAEDIAQDAFIRIFERWDSVRTMDNPSGYLYRTALNRFRNEYRRTTQALRRAVGLVPPPDVFEAVDDHDLAVQTLGRLPARQRAALVLTEGLGFSGEETGAILGVKASTVWALTHQAREALKATREEVLDG
ncbi:MAG TPA: RNA polymerase sigma factor [Actinomycetota bacterium]